MSLIQNAKDVSGLLMQSQYAVAYVLQYKSPALDPLLVIPHVAAKITQFFLYFGICLKPVYSECGNCNVFTAGCGTRQWTLRETNTSILINYFDAPTA
jgi:hypothetical protein